MNENIDLTKILKDCPKGWELHTSIWGKVRFEEMQKNEDYPVLVLRNNGMYASFSRIGNYDNGPECECCLFPSKEQRDWNKFAAPWYKKEKFDPKTLKPFDRVICKGGIEIWRCNFFSSYNEEARSCPNVCVSGSYARCIPYNEETKHLVGTTDEAPEYYRYWKDDRKDDCKHNTEDIF